MKNKVDYDIVIVGAGPAGATLARLLPANYRVLILDKKPIGEEIDHKTMKCCGGLLSETAQKVMAQMDLMLPAEVLIEEQPFRLKVMDLNYPITRSYQKHYYNMDRAKFEMWLISLIPDSVEKRGNYYVKDFHRCQAGVELIVRDRDAKIDRVIKTKLVVAADGASSGFRRYLYPNLQWKKYVSIQEWYENIDNIDHYSAIIDDEITDFYAWYIPKDNAVILGAAFDLDTTEGTPSERFLRLKEKLENRGMKFGKKLLREGCEIVRPTNNRVVTGNRRIALIGEAGGFISPSSSEGFSYAFRTAKMLADAIKKKGLRRFAECYAKRTKRLRTNIMLRNIKSFGMYHNFTRRMVLKAGWGSID